MIRIKLSCNIKNHMSSTIKKFIQPKFLDRENLNIKNIYFQSGNLQKEMIQY